MFFISLPAEQVTKPAFQFSELFFQFFMEPTSPPFFPEPFIPKMARVAKKHRSGVYNKHRVIERIVFRSAVSPRASFSVFIREGLYPVATVLLRPRTRAVFILRTSLCKRRHDQLVIY